MARGPLLLGLLLLAGALALGLLRGGAEPLGAALFALDPALLNVTQAVVQRYLAPWIWDSALLPLLERPVWLVPAVLGALCLDRKSVV